MSPRSHSGHATRRRPCFRPGISVLAWAGQRLALIGAAVALFAALHCTARAAETPSYPSVLILCSNQRPLPANVVIDDTLRRVVPEALGRPVEVFSEFLDIERFSGEGYAAAVADFLRQKYGQLNVGVMLPVVPHEKAVGDRVGQQRLHRLIEEGLALRLRRQRAPSKGTLKDLPVSARQGGLRSGLDGTSNRSLFDAVDE